MDYKRLKKELEDYIILNFYDYKYTNYHVAQFMLKKFSNYQIIKYEIINDICIIELLNNDIKKYKIPSNENITRRIKLKTILDE